MNHTILQMLRDAQPSVFQKVASYTLPEDIPHGDMPGDKILIENAHIEKAQKLMAPLVDNLITTLECKQSERCVISVCGGSGVGKSETASLLAWYLGQLGLPCYVLSGDNYPYRIPVHNDAERMRIFRDNGIKGLFAHGVYTPEIGETLHTLMLQDQDAAPSLCEQYHWLALYQSTGRNALKGYLGTSNEIDFTRVTDIIVQFQNGAKAIMLKRMGREEAHLWYDLVDFSNISVLIIEWTHSNSDFLSGVDIPILLNSTPQETLAHRRQRNRDGKIDSPFTTMVLEIEQALLTVQAHKAKIIMSKDGQLLTYPEFCRIMK